MRREGKGKAVRSYEDTEEEKRGEGRSEGLELSRLEWSAACSLETWSESSDIDWHAQRFRRARARPSESVSGVTLCVCVCVCVMVVKVLLSLLLLCVPLLFTICKYSYSHSHSHPHDPISLSFSYYPSPLQQQQQKDRQSRQCPGIATQASRSLVSETTRVQARSPQPTRPFKEGSTLQSPRSPA